jgi:DedD protein
VASAPTSTPVSSAPAQPASTAAAAPEVAKAPPAASAEAEPLPGGAGAAAGTIYTVNLGVYANHASANKLVAKAKQNGFTALATPETWQGKSVMRVRVGPFHNRAEAEAARLKLQDIEHVSMAVETGTVNQTGDAPASAIAAAQPGAWAVQLAAFSDESSANKLRDRLRGQGFDGYVDSVKTSKGKLWRVRAGPFASRNVAESTRGQIADKLKISGNIVAE